MPIYSDITTSQSTQIFIGNSILLSIIKLMFIASIYTIDFILFFSIGQRKELIQIGSALQDFILWFSKYK